MPRYCFNKPNRKKVRHFSSCDAARIAREVVKDDITINRVHVLACIAKGLGFTHICLTKAEYELAAKEAQGADFIDKLVKGATYLDKVVNYLNANFVAPIPEVPIEVEVPRGTLKLPPISINKTSAIVGVIVALLIILKKSVDVDTKLDKNARSCYPVEDVIIKIYCNCKGSGLNNQNLR